MAYLISLLVDILTWIIIIQVLLSYFVSPYHPLRQALDRIVEPMLAPIRRVVPSFSGVDFSPLVLLIIIQIIGSVLVNLLH